jgi:ankyrin repeat protein
MSTTEHDNQDILNDAREYAKYGKVADLERLELDPESLAKPIRLQTLGTVASTHGQDNILRFPHNKGVDLLCNVQLAEGKWIRTPLFVAVCNDMQSTVELLLSFGADPCRQKADFVKRSPIHQAILTDNKPLLEKIWARDPSFVQPRLASGALSVVAAMPSENSPPTEGSLFHYVLGKFEEQDLNIKDTEGFAAVHHAAHRNLKDHIQLLLRANPTLVDATGQTPIEIAIAHGFDVLTHYLNANQRNPEAMRDFRQSKQELAHTTERFL